MAKRVWAAQSKRNSWFHFLLVVVGLILGMCNFPAKAFMTSDEEQFRADEKEALSRARDFQKTIRAREREARDLEEAGHEETVKREKAEARREAIREDFVRLRNEAPSEDVTREQLEREDTAEKDAEIRKMDEIRRDYVKKRNEVRAVIEHDAHIDENKEYGL